MSDWWSSLGLALQVFYGIAIVATAGLAFQLVLRLFGLDDMHTGDLSHGEHPGGLQLISVSSLIALGAGFGWAGVIALRAGAALPVAITAALVAGGGLMLVQVSLMRFLFSLHHSGSLDYANAIGQAGTAYCPIPPARAPGGQVQVTCQGRMITAQALTDHAAAIPTGAQVTVVAVIAPATLVVAPA